MLAAWASSAASRLGGGQKARVAARGPKRKPPLLAAALPWADQLPRARLQLSCIVTLPSRLSSIVYVVPGLGRVVPAAALQTITAPLFREGNSRERKRQRKGLTVMQAAPPPGWASP